MAGEDSDHVGRPHQAADLDQFADGVVNEVYDLFAWRNNPNWSARNKRTTAAPSAKAVSTLSARASLTP
ncbi:hypothetical protein ABZ705_14100 [Streptomyces sp. NPDC006984]|uniref:hypothetical protein n=1 Tax=unclassified Streptomyces TaxID=2593676 RepID=UPI00340B3772